jgi:indoleacetamide hydrolase
MTFSDLSAIEALSALRSGEITATEYVQALLERCERYHELNAFISLNYDRAHSAAKRADKVYASKGELGPLHGLPFVLKDNIDTSEIATTGGTPTLRNHRPSTNAPVAQALIDAGAILLGKTNLHELAGGVTSNNTAFGPVRNPYDRNKISGGSSGGTAVAVSARLAPVGLGTDTGGSVRIPAALCGIIGFRPTSLRYPQAGILPISHTRDTAGPITRSVADAALLDGIITKTNIVVTAAELDGLRLGVPRDHFYENIDSRVADVVETTLSRLRDYGIILVEANIPDIAALDQTAGFPVALYEQVADLNHYLASHHTGLDFAGIVAGIASPDVKGMLASLLSEGAIPETVYQQALKTHRPSLQRVYQDYFVKHRVAAVVFPTTPLPATPIGEDETVMLNGEAVSTFLTFIRNTSPASVAGIPGLTLPAGMGSDGLPIGIEFDGPAGSDKELLAIGLAIEAVEPSLPAPNLPV